MIKFSTTTEFCGKPKVNNILRTITSPCGKKRISALTHGFYNQINSFEQLFYWLTVDGYPYAPNLKIDGHKHGNNFDSSYMLFIDIDSGMSIAELLDDRLYKTYGSGYYTTASHTDSEQRFRIMFRLETPITNADDMVLLYKRLICYYGKADGSCKDPCRMFYGSINAQQKEITTRFLPDSNMRNILNAQRSIESKQKQKQEHAKTAPISHEPLSDQFKERVIELSHSMYLGKYPEWIRFGWGLKEGGFDVSDYIYITQGMMSKKSSADAERVWNSGKPGSCTMGTCIFMLKRHHGQDCFKGIAYTPAVPDITKPTKAAIDIEPVSQVPSLLEHNVCDQKQDNRNTIEYINAIAGAGKTYCTIKYVVQEYRLRNKIMIAVPTNKLMDQIEEDFDKYSLNIAKIQGSTGRRVLPMIEKAIDDDERLILITHAALKKCHTNSVVKRESIF